MAKRSLGKCRFYAPLDQYLKAKGYYRGGKAAGVADGYIDAQEVWNMNPTQPFKHTLSNENNGYIYEFFINTDPPETWNYNGVLPNENKELQMLLSKSPETSDLSKSGFYLSALGHKILDTNAYSIRCEYFGSDGEGGTPSSDAIETSTEFDDNVNTGGLQTGVTYNGYSIAHFNAWDSNEPLAYNIFRVYFKNPDGVMNEGQEASVGALSWGRWFEPEHSLDLQATITDSYDGIKAQTTIGGNTLTNINYLSHDWGDLPAWTLEKQAGNDYKIGGRDGRRQWKVSLSYLQDDDLFHTTSNENQFFSYDDETDDYTFDASMSSFFKMTLMGKLPFIFCPDSSATDLEFALCKIDKDPSFKQVANNLFSTNFTITEVF